MAGIISFVFIIVVMSVLKGIGKSETGKSPIGKTSTTVNPAAYATKTGAGPQVIGGNYVAPISQTPQKSSSKVNYGRTAATTTATTSKASNVTNNKITSDKPADERVEKSTMDYLQEKAKADQIEHAKEKFEEAKRLDAVHGRKPAAGRYMLGDPIPHGHKIIYCPYCAAENIVPNLYYGDKSCYFCRTHLK